MIVFVAPFPALADEKDGMIQRVASIDSLVSDMPRVYLDISFRKFWFKRTHQFGDATVIQLHALLHFLHICAILRKASLVYIHSVHNSLRAIPAYWIAAPITDLHGAVPEELLYQGMPWRARVLGIIEKIALTRSGAVIHVTSAMKRHFQRKYSRQSASDRTVAILPKLADVALQRAHVLGAARDSRAVIYAGGLQAWQNVAMMLAAAAAAPQQRYVFLSGEALALRELAEAASVGDFTCDSAAPNQVANYYLKCTYGFVLRDPVLLNQVACPTKLVEYLYWGVIPIVLTPDIGDFVEFGFQFVSLDAFRDGQIPDDFEAARMREVNLQVVERMMASCNGELIALQETLRRG
jgi:hypothetical protein